MTTPHEQAPSSVRLRPFRPARQMTPPLPLLDLHVWWDRIRSELVFMYLGGPSCGFCRDPEYRTFLKQARDQLRLVAEGRKQRLRTVGASDGWSVPDGVVFLIANGPWDEIVAGNNMYNSAMIEHIWTQPGVTPGVPHVVVFERQFRLQPGGLSIVGKRYLARLIGKGELRAWLEAGLPLAE